MGCGGWHAARPVPAHPRRRLSLWPRHHRRQRLDRRGAVRHEDREGERGAAQAHHPADDRHDRGNRRGRDQILPRAHRAARVQHRARQQVPGRGGGKRLGRAEGLVPGASRRPHAAGDRGDERRGLRQHRSADRRRADHGRRSGRRGGRARGRACRLHSRLRAARRQVLDRHRPERRRHRRQGHRHVGARLPPRGGRQPAAAAGVVPAGVGRGTRGQPLSAKP